MMGPTSRIQQAYGYAVCLIAIIVGLISLHSLVDAAFDWSRPVPSTRSGVYAGDASTGSFEEFKASFGRPPGDPKAARDSLPPDSVLHRIYEDKLAISKANEAWEANKNLVKSSLAMLAAIILFSFHWRWLRPQSAETLAMPGPA